MIVATILLVVGWFLVISTTKVPPLDLSVGPRGAEYVWSQSAGETFPVSTFFRPSLSLIGYAFLGAYVFTLFHVIRGYHRRDLHPEERTTRSSCASSPPTRWRSWWASSTAAQPLRC